MKNSSSSSSSSWHLYGWFVCLIGAIFYSYEYFLRITPSVMTNELRAAFGGISSFAVGHLAAYYYYVYTPMQLPVGVLMDRFGPRRLLAFACFVCAIGAYLFAYTYNFHVAAGGRVLMGFGSAFAFVGVLSLAAHWLPPQNFALIAGLTTTLGMIGGMQGQVVLAKLVDGVGWRETLIYSAHIGIVLTFIIYLFIRDKKSEPYSPAQSVLTFKELFRGLLRALSNPQILLAGVIGSLLYLSLSAFAELWAVSYLETVYQLSKVDAAKAVSMVFFGWAIGGPIAGYISDRMQRRVLPLTIGAILATIVSLILLYVPNLSLTAVYTCLFLYGVFCSTEIIVFALGRENSPPELAGIGIATVNMLVMIGGVITQPLIGKLLDLFVGAGSAYSTSAFQQAMLLLPIGTFIAVILTYFVRETNCIIPTKH